MNVTIKALKSGKETSVPESTAKNLVGRYPNDYEMVTTSKPKVAKSEANEEAKPKKKRTKKND